MPQSALASSPLDGSWTATCASFIPIVGYACVATEVEPERPSSPDQTYVGVPTLPWTEARQVIVSPTFAGRSARQVTVSEAAAANDWLGRTRPIRTTAIETETLRTRAPSLRSAQDSRRASARARRRSDRRGRDARRLREEVAVVELAVRGRAGTAVGEPHPARVEIHQHRRDRFPLVEQIPSLVGVAADARRVPRVIAERLPGVLDRERRCGTELLAE